MSYQGKLQGLLQGKLQALLQGLAQAEPGPGAGLPLPRLGVEGREEADRNSDTPKPIPKPRKFGPERLPQDHPLMGNKETVLEYLDNLGQRGKRLDSSLLSAHRRRVVMMYLQESIDERNAKYSKPIPRAVDNDVRMEDFVPEESDIACYQEVMTGYENKPIVLTSWEVEPLQRHCAPGAECNETISFVPK